ncbi:PGRS repeat-containing protein, partial [Tsukamurella soli]
MRPPAAVVSDVLALLGVSPTLPTSPSGPLSPATNPTTVLLYGAYRPDGSADAGSVVESVDSSGEPVSDLTTEVASAVSTAVGDLAASPLVAALGQIPVVDVFIGDGTNGTATDPDGGAGGLLIGDGGAGYDETAAGVSGGDGGSAGLIGDGGAGGSGGAGAA